MDLVRGILGAVRPPVRVGVLGILALASVLLVSGCESQRDEPPGLVSTPAAATVAPTPAPTATIPATPAAATVAPTPAPAATPSAAAVATAIPTPTPAPAPAPTGITSNAAAVTAAPTPTPTPMPAGMNGVATEPVGRPHPSDAYFALDHVLDVAIDLASEDWDSLRTQTRAFADVFGGADCLAQPFDSPYSWFPAQVTVDGETRADVGVRKKGFLGSGNTEKPSLKLRFDKYVDGQLLGGIMERMTLNNSTQDESLINTCLAYQVFADAGLPVPRCNFATVSVNGENLGLYVHVEDLKTSMVERSFANPEGNLYEGTMSDFRPEWRGTFEKKTNEDADDWSDINAVVAALQDPTPAGLTALDAAIDRDRFLSFWATEVLVGHWDGYASNRNNFYFYGEPGAPLVFIPWGVDQVFSTTDNLIDGVDTPPSVMAHGAIAHRLYRDDATRAAYANRLRELLDTVWNEAQLLQRADELAAIVQTHAPTETRAGAASDTDRVRRFIRARRAEVLADLEPEPPAWPWPQAEAADFCRGGSGAFESGTFELRFETTWGSKESGDPINEGTVTYTHFQLDGTEQRVNLSGVTAGIASPEEAADWGIGEAAVIAISNVKPGFAADGFSVWVPIDRVSSGSGLVIGMDDGVGGAYWSLLIGADEPVRFVPLIEGGIEFDEAGTETGATVSGRIYGAFEFEGPASTDTAAPAAAGLVINEIAAAGEPLDWFEIYNSSDAPITLADFVMADDLTDENARTPFPADMLIEPGEYLQIPLDKDGWPGFGLGGDEELGLWTKDGSLVDSVDWAEGQAGEGQSYARFPDGTGDFQTVSSTTPGAANQP